MTKFSSSGRCQQYGHSCLGGHGKRSGHDDDSSLGTGLSDAMSAVNSGAGGEQAAAPADQAQYPSGAAASPFPSPVAHNSKTGAPLSARMSSLLKQLLAQRLAAASQGYQYPWPQRYLMVPPTPMGSQRSSYEMGIPYGAEVGDIESK